MDNSGCFDPRAEGFVVTCFLPHTCFVAAVCRVAPVDARRVKENDPGWDGCAQGICCRVSPATSLLCGHRVQCCVRQSHLGHKLVLSIRSTGGQRLRVAPFGAPQVLSAERRQEWRPSPERPVCAVHAASPQTLSGNSLLFATPQTLFSNGEFMDGQGTRLFGRICVLDGVRSGVLRV